MASVIVQPERDAERRASKDIPHLSVALDASPSASPGFPSPSSSFLPPPIPSSHEFANKIPLPGPKGSAGAKKQLRERERDTTIAAADRTPSPSHTSSPTTVTASMNGYAQPPSNGDVKISDNNKEDISNTTTSNPSTMSSLSTPPSESTTPVCATVNLDVESEGQPTTPRTKHISLPLLSSPIRAPPTDTGAPSTPTHRAKHSSLSSSRPAPPSPSISRRESGAGGGVGGTRSRPISRALSTSTSASTSIAPRPASQILANSTISSPSHSSQQKRRARSPAKIHIRDFAYASGDVRHIGEGPDAPRLDRSSIAFSDSDFPGESSRRGSSLGGWGGAFRWGSRLWGLGFGSGNGSGGGREGEGPTRSDFERNFDMSSPADEYPEGEMDSAYAFARARSEAENPSFNDDSERAYSEDEDDGELVEEETQLFPGLYRALYAFEPEGTAEMALAEDQIVRIVGRGGGVGWAVAVREDASGGGGGGVVHALVPESYLEVVKLDDDADDEE